MKTLRVKLKEKSYDIIIAASILKNCGSILRKLKIGGSAFIITNSTIASKYARLLQGTLKKNNIDSLVNLVPDTEKSKSFQSAAKLIKKLSDFDQHKQVFIIALGGGVVGDLSGFVASIYKRGIPYIQIPTSLLAQVDSAIGGKTAIDLSKGKNLVGAFYQPRLVLSDVSLLKSLPKAQLCAGLAEVIKYGVIKDAKLFTFIEKNLPRIRKRELTTLESVVISCSRIKAEIVSKDEFEKQGLRTILNFGHTIGHALEAASGYQGYSHGQAVGLGMIVAAKISLCMGLSKVKTVNRIRALIKTAGLPVKIKNAKLARIITAHYSDKKFCGKKNRFVLVEKIGKVKVVENIPLEIIEKSLLELLETPGKS